METRYIWPFELLDKLGEGGMGVVYRARYVGNDRVVAVKLLPADADANATTIARFEREMEVLKQLEHPNIVHCFGGTCEGSQRFYAMELVEGGTLSQLLCKKGRLNWYVAADYAIQMCEALQYAHERGVIHRDIKPGNFLLTKQGQIKLSDFGLVTVAAGRRLTATGRTIGTVEYMSPEQIRGKPPATNRSDLYSLGCVLVEMLTGSPPYVGETHIEVMQKHLREPIPHVIREVEDVPLELDQLICDLLVKTAEARPESAKLVAERLTSILQPGRRMHKFETKLMPVQNTAQTRLEPVKGVKASASELELDVPQFLLRSKWDWVIVGSLMVILFLSLAGWYRSSSRLGQIETAMLEQLGSSDLQSQLSAIKTLVKVKTLGTKVTDRLMNSAKTGPDELRMASLNAIALHADECSAFQWEIYKLQQSDAVSPAVKFQAVRTVDEIIKARSATSSWSLLSLIWMVVIAALIGLGGFWIWRQFFTVQKLAGARFGAPGHSAS